MLTKHTISSYIWHIGILKTTLLTRSQLYSVPYLSGPSIYLQIAQYCQKPELPSTTNHNTLHSIPLRPKLPNNSLTLIPKLQTIFTSPTRETVRRPRRINWAPHKIAPFQITFDERRSGPTTSLLRVLGPGEVPFVPLLVPLVRAGSCERPGQAARAGNSTRSCSRTGWL